MSGSARPSASNNSNNRNNNIERSVSSLASSSMPNTRRTSTSSNPEQEAEPSAMLESTASLQSNSNNSTSNAGPGSSTRRTSFFRNVDYGSIQTPSVTPSRTLQPPTTPGGSQRPNLARRTPSSAAPHRGEIFSTDDDADEVTLDLRLARAQTKQEKERERERQLRRRESTVKRRPVARTPTLTVLESDEREDAPVVDKNDGAATKVQFDNNGDPSSEDTLQGEDEGAEDAEEEEETPPEDDDSADLSDAESFTLKDRQDAINETHPFGIRIWKPALYKKTRSVQREAESNIHSAPQSNVNRGLWVFNILWTLLFGWWLSLLAGAAGVLCMICAVVRFPGCSDYGRVLINLAHYLFFPFGKYVRLEVDEAYLDEDEGEGRSIGEYERWQTGDLEEGRLFFGPLDVNRSIIGRRRDEVEDAPPDENDSLLGRTNRQTSTVERARNKTRKRLFGRGKWNAGRVIFFLSFYFLIAPCLLVVSLICWFLVFSIPMGKVTLLVFYHLRRHPLALSFHVDSHYSRVNSVPRGSKGSVILLCTYRAVGYRYWKYTIDGTNIILINLLGLVAFTIFDWFVLHDFLGIRVFITSPGLLFVLALASIIPLAYFIGQAVASISAQSSMGVGATVNAFFSTIVEVFLYCIALRSGKGQLVEGSIIGSIFAGILFLPGLSMCFGAIKRKTQRFNVRSAGVTSTMLLFAVIGSFGPTLFYQIYGSHELNCHQCINFGDDPEDRDCRRCFFSQIPAVNDRFFQQAVKPYVYFATVCLFLSYMVGLLFTLRTHAAVIWNNEPDEKKEVKTDPAAANRHEERHASIVPGTAGLAIQDPARPGLGRGDTTGSQMNIRESQMYKRILTQSLKQSGMPSKKEAEPSTKADTQGVHLVPPKPTDGTGSIKNIRGLSREDNQSLFQQVAEMAATAAVVAARDATKPLAKKVTVQAPSGKANAAEGGEGHGARHSSETPATAAPAHEENQGGAHGGGHDAPNWGRVKSSVILAVATLAYAVIAEILVDTVDVVLANVDIDEKFLGITLFALVPNTTEFLNAISFAMNGNVALSMEIGGSYALQVMLLQVPCLVVFSAYQMGHVDPEKILDYTFTLIFPQWDMVTVILSVFLMGWVVGEGKSNYFKGSILVFSYLVVVVGFYFSSLDHMDLSGVNRFDTLAIDSKVETFRTIGRTRSGVAY